MKDVFIGNKAEEFADANRGKTTLETNGISCRMATMRIPGGSNCAVEIPQAISAAHDAAAACSSRPWKNAKRRTQRRIDMKDLSAMTEEFRAKYERFILGCDALEELESWDRDALGEMDVYYENELLGMILRLIVADGKISAREADSLNECFGFSQTPETLSEVYENCRERYERPIEDDFTESFRLLAAENEKLADAYRELLSLICDILIESDGMITASEIETAQRLRALVLRGR